MRARVFPGCKMAASTVYKHRVLGVAILHPGNTHALIGKFCEYVLGRTSIWEWISMVKLLIIFSTESDIDLHLSKCALSPHFKFCFINVFPTVLRFLITFNLKFGSKKFGSEDLLGHVAHLGHGLKYFFGICHHYWK